jgi:two-component system LytT family response regulator
MLQEQAPDTIALAGIACSVDEARTVIGNATPDLVFLDVQLHDQTGFDLLQQLPAHRFEVIFTTAYDQYAVQAFRCSALDYLLKPIDAADLQQALGKITAVKEKNDATTRLSTLLYNLQCLQGTYKRICVPVMNGFTFIQVSDIVQCQSDINYTNIYFTDRQKLLVAKTLKEFEELLKEYNFYRVHNSHLVNLAYVKEYKKSGFITMTDNSVIPVSTRRKEEFLKKLTNL